MPKVIETAKYNGTLYYLVTYSNWPDHPWWDFYQLTKWHGLFNYEIDAQLDYLTWKGKFFYDKKTNLVNIVAVFDDRTYLLYTDDNPPRYYEKGSWQFEDYLYYISSKCSLKSYISKDKDIYTCERYTYTLYECELDNSGCAVLPFQYTGEEDYAFLDISEETNEIDFHVNDTLAYSYGEHPRCSVAGCEILKSTK